MVPESVVTKLAYAESRLDGLRQLINQNTLAADALGRQQLLQEFCFHAVGATDYVAQLVNEDRALSILKSKASVETVASKLARLDYCDPAWKPLTSLVAKPSSQPLPEDPYSSAGMVYRLINYRNEVVRRDTNPFHFALSAGPRVAFLYLDPRHPNKGLSKDRVDVDLANIFDLISCTCTDILKML